MPRCASGVVDALSFAGYEVLAAADGREGMELALRARLSLLLLDLVLPHHSGFEILEALKKERPGQPVIILSARGEEGDRVKGLKMGADDYVVKPFSVRELLARVDAVLRRTSERPAAASEFAFPGGVADFVRHEVRFDDGSQRGALGARVRTAALPRPTGRPAGVARGAAAQRVGARPAAAGDAHGGHARRPPAAEAARCRADDPGDGARAGVSGRRTSNIEHRTSKFEPREMRGGKVIWGVLGVCGLLIAGAMAWFTWKMLELERGAGAGRGAGRPRGAHAAGVVADGRGRGRDAAGREPAAARDLPERGRRSGDGIGFRRS